MKINSTVLILAAAVAIIAAGCGPRQSSEPGKACFSIFTIGANGQRMNDITTVKVGQQVAVDISCAGACQFKRDVNWGDGYWGEYITHKYEKPGTYTVKYTCSDRSQRASSYARKHKRHYSGGRYESSKTLIVTQ